MEYYLAIKKCIWISSNKVDETGTYYTEWNKSASKTPIQYINTRIYIEFRKMVTMTLYVRQQKKHRCKEQTFELWEKVMVGWFERIALKRVYYHMWNRSPVQVRCMKQVLRAGALGWPRGMGWGGRWKGGSGWGTHVNPWLIHVNVWQKPLQYCKVISLQLK